MSDQNLRGDVPLSDAWADRINDAYFDKMGEEFGRKTRDRINWMCSQAVGKSVLDIGCSQGIASVLLAREGMDVLGIDIHQPTIEQAEKFRTSESHRVSEKIEFRCQDLNSFEGGVFDTILMGEVIEHQTNPVKFVAKAITHLADGGRLIVTVPFGLHPWPDHKSTVFPRTLMEGISHNCELESLTVQDDYIRMVARKIESSLRPQSDGQMLLEATEHGAVSAQREVLALRSRLSELEKDAARIQAEKVVSKDIETRFVQLHETLTGTARAVENSAAAAVDAVRGAVDRVGSESEEIRRVVTQGVAQYANNGAALIGASDKIIEVVDRMLERANASIEANKTESSRLMLDIKRSLQDAMHSSWLDRLMEARTLLAQTKARLAVVDEDLRCERTVKQALEAEITATHPRLTGLQSKIDQLEKHLEIAQQKRDGHYLHLEAERARSKALLEMARRLHEENQVFRNSIALTLGKAILDMRRPAGFLKFPSAIMSGFRVHKERAKGRVAAIPFVPPRIAPVVLPSAKKVSSVGQAAQLRPQNQSGDISTLGEVKRLSGLGWTQDIDRSKPVMMSVFDEFSRACFAPQASLVEPRPDNWETLLDRYEPRLLFVESSWKGNYGTWQYRVANYAHPPGRELREMVSGCRARGVPTVFWNKEDPVHFSNFIDAASTFDHVFTTAAEALPMYGERTTAKVGVLQFAAEESLHNPIGSANRNQRICFAGSFYANRFHERRDDQLMLLDAASRFDLDIYDRNHNPKALARSDFEFPERFAPFIKPAIPYSEMASAYRKYRVFLNVNSVIDSPTMFSRRVFELLACGTPIVSTWSKGIEETFGDLVWLVKTPEEADEALRVLVHDDTEWRRRSLAGIRSVLGKHTFRHRFQDVLKSVGIDFKYDDVPNMVQVLSPVASSVEALAAMEAFDRQEMPEGVGKKLVLFCEGDVRPDMLLSNVVVVPVNAALTIEDIASHPIVEAAAVQALMLPTCAYGDTHLLDLLLAKRYSDATMVGKARDKTPNNEYRFGIPLEPGSVLFDAAKLRQEGGLSAWLNADVPSSDPHAHRTFAIDRDGFAVVGCVADPVGVSLALSARH